MRSISPRLFTFACLLLLWALWSLAAEPPEVAGDSLASGDAQTTEAGIEQSIKVVE